MLLVYFQSLEGESRSETFFLLVRNQNVRFSFALEFLDQLNGNFLMNKKYLPIIPTVSYLLHQITGSLRLCSWDV